MKIRLILGLAAILIFCGGTWAIVQETGSPDLLQTADEMLKITSRLRNLEPMAPISRGVKSREEISKFLNEKTQEEYNDREIKEEEKLLRLLGLLPASITNYKEFVLKLYAEQIGGFYDPAQKTFFIASWLPVEEQKPVMVHELTHALQDQHFKFGEILKADQKAHNDDRALAHQAFIEGDAMAVMLNYQLEPSKMNFSQMPDMAIFMKSMQSTEMDRSPTIKSAPAFLRESLIFPYASGVSFLQKFWVKNPSWKSVDMIYSDMPASSEQIMHPEKYFGKRDAPITVNAEEIASRLGKQWRITYRNVLGEFSLNLLLNLYLTDARAGRSAAGWGGDEVCLIENEKGKNAALISTVWDAENEAEEFFLSMQQWLKNKHPKGITTIDDKNFLLVNGDEIDKLKLEGTAVNIIIGFPKSERKNLAEF
jgi:hypothetical protein